MYGRVLVYRSFARSDFVDTGGGTLIVGKRVRAAMMVVVVGDAVCWKYVFVGWWWFGGGYLCHAGGISGVVLNVCQACWSLGVYKGCSWRGFGNMIAKAYCSTYGVWRRHVQGLVLKRLVVVMVWE